MVPRAIASFGHKEIQVRAIEFLLNAEVLPGHPITEDPLLDTGERVKAHPRLHGCLPQVSEHPQWQIDVTLTVEAERLIGWGGRVAGCGDRRHLDVQSGGGRISTHRKGLAVVQ